DIGDSDRVGENAAEDQAGDMRDVRHQVRADFIGDFAELVPVGRIGIAGVTGDDYLRLVLNCQRANRVIVQPFGFRVDAIAHSVVELAAAGDGAAMRQVAALQQVHAHNRVADVDQRGENGAVGGRAGKRLHVYIQAIGVVFLGGEQLGGAATSQRFDDVGVFRALVITLVRNTPVLRQTRVIVQNFGLSHGARLIQRIAFRVDVVKSRANRLAHRRRHSAFGRNHDQIPRLPRSFMAYQV